MRFFAKKATVQETARELARLHEKIDALQEAHDHVVAWLAEELGLVLARHRDGIMGPLVTNSPAHFATEQGSAPPAVLKRTVKTNGERP